jgi:hypothetical protein
MSICVRQACQDLRMSWVSNVLLSVGIEDQAAVEVFNAWLLADAPRRDGAKGVGVGFLADLTSDRDNLWGGPKQPECQVWGRRSEPRRHRRRRGEVRTLPWRVPAAVQLLIMDQEQSYFRLWMLRDGVPKQYAPAPPGDDSAW